MISEESPSLLSEIKKCIEENFSNIKVTGCFSSGTEVVERLHRTSADIVISSIDSISRSGLLVAQYVFQHKRDTEVILTSGYRQFEYAKQAIDYKVSSFLVKPFYLRELISAVSSAVNRIEDNLSRAYSEAKGYLLEWEWKQQNLALVYGSIISLDSLLKKRHEFFKGKMLDECNCAEVSVKFPNFDKYMRRNWHGNKNAFYDAVRDVGEGETDDFSAFMVASDGDVIKYVVISDRINDGILSFCENLRSGMKNLYKAEVDIGVKIFGNMQELLKSNKNSRLVDSFLTALVNDNSEKVYKTSIEIEKENDPKRIYAVLDEINDKLKRDYDIDLKVERDIYKDEHQLLNETLKRTESALSSSKYLVVAIKDFMRKNFNNNMSIESVAQAFSMSPSYLGRAFKEETGEKLIDYLVELKFEKAKEMLQTGNYTVKEVVHTVGYSQPKYFSRVFKERVGMTPSEFMKAGKNENVG